MHFSIEHKSAALDNELIYINDDDSFDMIPEIKEINFFLIINMLNLTAVGRYIVRIDGLCPRKNWIKGNFNIPSKIPGALRVLDERESGFSYRIDGGTDWQIYEDITTGWICVGNPKSKGQAVEFIKNCVAVIDGEKLTSLWLKPKFE